jgi:hypothetical protein
MCQRRMFGKARRERNFYVCSPKPGYVPDGHPKSLWIKEAYLLDALHTFFAEPIFGPDRHALLAAALPEVDASEKHRHDEREKALRATLADLAQRRERQFHALELADGLDRRFVQGVQARVADLDEQIRAKEADISRLRHTAPARQDPGLIDALAGRNHGDRHPARRHAPQALRSLPAHHPLRQPHQQRPMPSDHLRRHPRHPRRHRSHGRRESDEPHRPERWGFVSHLCGAPGRIRTCDTRFRSGVESLPGDALRCFGVLFDLISPSVAAYALPLVMCCVGPSAHASRTHGAPCDWLAQSPCSAG